jgi:hypothetical protein
MNHFNEGRSLAMRFQAAGRLVLVLLLIAASVVGCDTSTQTKNEVQSMLSATFKECAAVVRSWAEACLAGDLGAAARMLSLTNTDMPEVCLELANNPDRKSLEVAGIEDEISLLSTGELTLFIRDKSTGSQAAISVTLANGLEGPVIASVGSMGEQYLSATYLYSVLDRANAWVDAGVPYDPQIDRNGYRTDAAGLVSYAWQLQEAGKPVSPDAAALGESYARGISYSQLRQGDILNNSRSGSDGHAVLFVGWIRQWDAFLAYDLSRRDGKAVLSEFTLVQPGSDSMTIMQLEPYYPGPYQAQRKGEFPSLPEEAEKVLQDYVTEWTLPGWSSCPCEIESAMRAPKPNPDIWTDYDEVWCVKTDGYVTIGVSIEHFFLFRQGLLWTVDGTGLEDQFLVHGCSNW